jgi:chromosome partitioning protein
MAAAVLIAGDDADPSRDPATIARTLAERPARPAFDLSLAAELLHRFAEQIRLNPDRGLVLARKTVSAFAGMPEDARFVLRGGIALGRRTGGLSPPQAERIRELAADLRVDPHDLWADNFLDLGGGPDRPLVIAVGNEKGGTGKSTIAMHLVVALLKLGYRVGSIDLDGRQATLSHFIENRRRYRATRNEAIAMPLHRRVEPAQAATREAAARQDRTRLGEALVEAGDCQVIVMDTPGSDTRLSGLAHANADMVITPLNDTFLDVDVLAEVDRDERRVLGPSLYCEMVVEQNDRRLLSAREPIHWIVMRNRVTHVDSYSKREIIGLLKQLSGRLGFQLVAGFGERVVFHELFLSGLTLLDLPDEPVRDRNYASHLRACEEFRDLLLEIGALV